MSESVIVALIVLMGTLVSGFVTAKVTRDKVMNELQIQNEVQNTKLEYIAKEFNKFNKSSEKIIELETEIKVLEERIKVANNRISDLESN